MFEKSNPNVSVNIYGLNDLEEVYPLKFCAEEKKSLWFITYFKWIGNKSLLLY